MSTLSLTVQPEADGAVLISPHGEIDADNAHEIREEVSGLLATSTPVCIKVDLGGVSFIDSVGIGALVGCYHAAAASNVRFVVINPTAYVHRVLYVSGLLGLFGSPARPPDQPRRSDQPRLAEQPRLSSKPRMAEQHRPPEQHRPVEQHRPAEPPFAREPRPSGGVR